VGDAGRGPDPRAGRPRAAFLGVLEHHAVEQLPRDDEEQLAETLAQLWSKLANPDRAIANIHVPPFDSGLDEAPVLDRELRVQQAVGQVKMAAVGSHAVRAILEERQPLLSLHGHIHESHGFRRLGRTLAVNPGSDYGTGALNGVLLTIDADRVRAHQFVRG
jgi:Icc-related predicted phosphoesterase